MSSTQGSWSKSSFSAQGNCVEVKVRDGRVLVRDSKDARSPVLSFTYAEWDAFVRGVRAREFDPPIAAAG